jgi:biopolymer transport protein ExbB
MKYFHSLIITGFLIPFLPLSAETEHTETPEVAFADPKEEASLTSLDEELSLLDEEFEEFKEELYSLENDLKKQETPSVLILEKFLNAEKSQEETIALEDENDVFNTLAPEMDDHNQISAKSELPATEKTEIQQQNLENNLAMEENGIQEEMIDEFLFSADESNPVLDSQLLSGIEITQPMKELAIDASKQSSIEETNGEQENAVEPIKLMTTAEPFGKSTVIERTDLTNESKASPLQSSLSKQKLAKDTPIILNVQGTSKVGELLPSNDDAIVIDIQQAFAGSPIIYSLLLAMSVIAAGIWLYSILSLRYSARVSHSLIKNLRNKLNSNNFDEALSLCEEKNHLLCKMIASGIHSRRHGLPVMIEAMKAEGKRASIAFWQKIGLLNDIAIIAPMLGLLGTVLGMFYAFYDVNRSIESISTLFDGLGISVGTTVAGLVVAILALIFHSTAKYRLVRALALVENEAQGVATLIDDRTSIYKGS